MQMNEMPGEHEVAQILERMNNEKMEQMIYENFRLKRAKEFLKQTLEERTAKLKRLESKYEPEDTDKLFAKIHRQLNTACESMGYLVNKEFMRNFTQSQKIVFMNDCCRIGQRASWIIRLMEHVGKKEKEIGDEA